MTPENKEALDRICTQICDKICRHRAAAANEEELEEICANCQPICDLASLVSHAEGSGACEVAHCVADAIASVKADIAAGRLLP